MTTPESRDDHDAGAILDGRVAWSRRAIVKLALVGIVGAAVGTGSTAVITRLSRTTRPNFRYFSDAEASLLIDICDQLIPRDDFPGAADTGAIEYIDRQLGGIFAAQQGVYRRGLESVRRTCLQKYQMPFQSLAPVVKIEVLCAIESGQVPAELWRDPSAQTFFNLVLAHTMQSFYGSPRHGGNRDYASYRMLGLDVPQVLGQNRYGKA